jgi:hypothetical protein
LGKAKALNILFKHMLLNFDISSQDLVMHIDSDISVYSEYIAEAEYCFSTYKDCKLFISYGTNNLITKEHDNCHKFNSNRLSHVDNYAHMPFCTGIARRCMDNDSWQLLLC